MQNSCKLFSYILLAVKYRKLVARIISLRRWAPSRLESFELRAQDEAAYEKAVSNRSTGSSLLSGTARRECPVFPSAMP